MKCSNCNENDAVIFVEEKDENGKQQSVGYCISCAKEHGIIKPSKSKSKNTSIDANANTDIDTKKRKTAKNQADSDHNDSGKTNKTSNTSNKFNSKFSNSNNINGHSNRNNGNANINRKRNLNNDNSSNNQTFNDDYLKNVAGLSSEDIDEITNRLREMVESITNGLSLNELNISAELQGISPEQLNDLVNGINENDDDDNDYDYSDENNDSFDPADVSSNNFGANGIEGMGFAIPLGNIFNKNFTNKIKNIGNLNNRNNSNNDDDDDSDGNSSHSTQRTRVKTREKNSKKHKFLNSFGTNLTAQARNGKIDNVIGREKEIARMIQILNRRTKNNPCLIGEPGVGKTAIAQGLALKIVEGNVPAKLMNKEIYLLDMTAIVAGTQFRGQFEARMKSIIDECKADGNVILVIDEIHNIIGAGDADHTMNAANILKPSLANGTIQLIGTTTLNEYRKYIEKDSALERRFQPVMVEEPSIEDSIQILEGIKTYYENYHKVQISNDIIVKLVNMSEKYIHDRFLPDKAIDVLDEACSRINLDNKDLYTLEVLKHKLKDVLEQKEEAANADSTDDYKKAAELKMQECSLTEQIQDLESKMVPKELTVEDIAKVIESWTKIPVQKITEEETQKLLNLEDNLHKRVIGQHEAVTAVSRAIRRNRAGLKSTHRPPSFIFVGPTGVGKTELAKALASEMFGGENSLIRVDMSEYMESNSTAKLIGAPPGYIGYDDAGQLTEKVKRHPYSVILLDEIEKAHPDVFNILLQILDDGRLTDTHGNTINFSNTIIIMTSNVGSDRNTNSIGFGTQSEMRKNKVLESMRETFRPEFLNRIDETVVFDSLKPEELRQIVDLMLADTQKVLNDKNIKMFVSDEAKDYLRDKGTDIRYGARPLRRTIERYIEDTLSDKILRSELKNGQEVFIDLKNDELTFKVE